MLCHSPDSALGLIEREYGDAGPSSLEELHVLHSGRPNLVADWPHWPLDRQERLAALLVRANPFARQPDGVEDFTYGTDLLSLRDAVLNALIQNRMADHVAAVDRLAALDPGLGQIVRTQRASSSAAQVIRSTAPNTVADTSALSLQTARQLLDRKDFRLIRSPDDLIHAVLFSLEKVQVEVGHDLSLLYFPARRGRSSKHKTEPSATLEREHLGEDALQSYLRRRLIDVLSGVVERVDVQIVREDQVAYRRRFDLRVMAPCQGNQQVATVVVEIKWSTNPETKTALVDQLGQKYLIGEQLTHGIYVVGWSGWWGPGQRRSKGRDPNELLQFLQTQRDCFCREGRPGEGVHIEPFVLDLVWHPEESLAGA